MSLVGAITCRPNKCNEEYYGFMKPIAASSLSTCGLLIIDLISFFCLGIYKCLDFIFIKCRNFNKEGIVAYESVKQSDDKTANPSKFRKKAFIVYYLYLGLTCLSFCASIAFMIFYTKPEAYTCYGEGLKIQTIITNDKCFDHNVNLIDCTKNKTELVTKLDPDLKSLSDRCFKPYQNSVNFIFGSVCSLFSWVLPSLMYLIYSNVRSSCKAINSRLDGVYKEDQEMSHGNGI